MLGTLHTINSGMSLIEVQGMLVHEFKLHKYLQVNVVAGKARTLPQNNMIYALYNRAAARLDGESPLTIKRYCKLHFGVPLLRVEDADFKDKWDRCIKRNLTYEQKLEVMDWFPVTSLMNTAQESQYIDNIMMEYDLEAM